VGKPLVSVTVCVRNGAHWIDDCMAALAAQTYRPLEIIAVDDGSSDGGTEVMQEWHDPQAERPNSNGISIRVLQQEPLGLSAGRNLALNEANGDWVAITDIDCRAEPDWISVMMASSDGVEAVTGRTIFEKGTTSVSRLRAWMVEAKYNDRPERASLADGSSTATLANGPCSMFRRENLITRGGFDPAWYHAEDMEVSMLILESGGEICYVADAVVNHVAEESLLKFLAKRRRDARAHVRILRGYRGVNHDFTSDARLIVTLLPIVLFVWSSFFMFGPLNFIAEWAPFWIVMASCFLVVMVAFRNHLLWSCALWLGAFEGCIDALLGRNGHKPLFGKQR
jgi:glycosyltransferase involved in cell wall biosynthesis